MYGTFSKSSSTIWCSQCIPRPLMLAAVFFMSVGYVYFSITTMMAWMPTRFTTVGACTSRSL